MIRWKAVNHPSSQAVMPRASRSPYLPRRARLAILASVAATLAVSATAAAHDFWLLPDLVAAASDSVLHVSGRSGVRFPNGSPVQPSRVVDARIIGAVGEMKIGQMSVEGGALRLHQKPEAAGQYLIAVALAPRVTRSTPAGLLRFLRAEGGAAEAARLEADPVFTTMDSVVFSGASYAATTSEIGRRGPRAFTRTAGFPLEFVPLNDPAHLHVGDTLHVRVLGAGKAVPGIGLDATPAMDSSTAVPPTHVAHLADAGGVVHVPLTKAGPWMLRSAYAIRGSSASSQWTVARSTYVVMVAGGH